MKRFRFVHRGIVLISVMFIAVLVGMYMLSASILSQGQFGALKQYNESRLAEEAARSGIEYALARLQENPQWRGDGNGVIVDSPTFSVREDNGNVVGLIRSADGGTAQFRLRFNFQDGNGGPDELDDPSGDMAFDSRPISVNNIFGGLDAPFYLGDGPNGRASTVLPYVVPSGMVALVCEGRVAPEFHQATAAAPNPASPRLQSVRTIEEIHRVEEVNGLLPVVSAVSMAGRKLDARLFNDGVIDLYDISGGKAKMRAREQVEVNNGTGVITGPNGEVMVPNSNPNAVLEGGVGPGEEDLNTAFYEVTWDQVREPRDGAGELRAGMYVHWNTPPGGLRYYDMSHSEYMSRIKNDPAFALDPGEPADLPPGMAFVPAGNSGPDGVTSNRNRFVVTDDVRVIPGDNTNDLTIMPRGGAKERISDTGGEGGGGHAPGGPPWADYVPEYTTDENVLPELFNSGALNDPQPGGTLHKFLTEISLEGEIDVAEGQLQWEYDDGQYKKLQYQGSITLQNFLANMFIGDQNATVPLKNLSGRNQDVIPGSGGEASLVRLNLGTFIKQAAGGGGGGSPAALKQIDLESKGILGEDLGPADFEMTFAPQDSNGLRLQGPGDIRLATDVRGHGASIKAEGQIRVVGVGMEMDAALGEDAPSVSLYAKGDIVVSTLRSNEDGEFEFLGLDLKGILYSWKNIELRSAEEDYPSPGVRIQGTMVAYGGDPSIDKPGEGGGGNIKMDGEAIDLIFDPSYLLGLTGGAGLTAVLGQVSTSYRN